MTEVNDRSTFCPKCGQHMELSPSKGLLVCMFCGWNERTSRPLDATEARKEVEKKFASKAEERRYNAAQEAKKERASIKRLPGNSDSDVNCLKEDGKDPS